MLKYLLFILLGFAPVGVGAVILTCGEKMLFALSFLMWPLFLFVWGLIGYIIGKRRYNTRLSLIFLHIPMLAALILSFVKDMPWVIEEIMLIIVSSIGFWGLVPRTIVNELWFFFLFYLAVMVLCCYTGIKLAEWKK